MVDLVDAGQTELRFSKSRVKKGLRKCFRVPHLFTKYNVGQMGALLCVGILKVIWDQKLLTHYETINHAGLHSQGWLGITKSKQIVMTWCFNDVTKGKYCWHIWEQHV